MVQSILLWRVEYKHHGMLGHRKGVRCCANGLVVQTEGLLEKGKETSNVQAESQDRDM